MDTIDNMTRCLERYLLQLDESEGRLRVLYPDGSAALSGMLNIHDFAHVGVALAEDAVDAEREDCARLCEGFSIQVAGADPYGRGLADGARAAAESLARMIRSRSAARSTLMAESDRDAGLTLPPLGALDPRGCPNTWWP